MIRNVGAYEDEADFEDFKIRATHCVMWRKFSGLERAGSIKAVEPWPLSKGLKTRYTWGVGARLKVHVVYQLHTLSSNSCYA